MKPLRLSGFDVLLKRRMLFGGMSSLQNMGSIFWVGGLGCLKSILAGLEQFSLYFEVQNTWCGDILGCFWE